jgi:hypothetical protein
VALALLVCAPLLAQEPDPLAPPAPSEEALRRETGALLLRLVREKTTPGAEEALLTLEVEAPGQLFEQTREVEVSLRRGDAGVDVRLRFRAPAELRDQAHLLLADGRAWRHDPARRRPERGAALEPTWRVGGGGLLLRDLVGDGDHGADATLVRDEGLLEAGVERAVHVVRTRAPGRGARLIFVDRERHVPLRTVEHDERGRVTRTIDASDWRWVQGRLRPFALEITEPTAAGARVTRVRVRERRPAAPPARFDPARFFGA